MYWEKNELYAVHNGVRILMGFIYNSVIRDDEWVAIGRYNGFYEQLKRLQTEYDIRFWLERHCAKVLKGWRENNERKMS